MKQVDSRREEGFLAHGSRREAEPSSPARPLARPDGAAEPGPPSAPPSPALPPIDALGGDDDYSAFLNPDIGEDLHRLALRRLFHEPRFNRRDGLDDYDDDHRHFVPRAADSLTSDMRHQVERRRASLIGADAPQAADIPSFDPEAAAAAAPGAIPGPKLGRPGGPQLPQASADRPAGVVAALEDSRTAARQTSTSLVDYRSAGALLIVGEPEAARAAAGRLCEPVTVAAVVARLASLSGHLGAFRAMLDIDGRPVNAALAAGLGRDSFDLVLDLNDAPVVLDEVPPPGYFAPRSDPAALDRALSEIPRLVGAFEKPRFFDFDAARCAHGRRGLTACERCIEACPTRAIHPLGDAVEIDPYRCQGCGSCALVCPSGAVRYAYPRPADLLDDLRQTLARSRQAGSGAPRLLFRDGEHGARTPGRPGDPLPADVLPVEVEAIGSTGMELWLAALAYGAAEVLLLAGPDTPGSALREIESQLDIARAVLEGMGCAGARLRLLAASDDRALAEVLGAAAPQTAIEPATFAGFDDKRLVMRLAVEHLHAQAPGPVPVAPLPAGAPFGEVRVDRETCTLCMACAAVCPSGALEDGGERPALRFTEAACVQCGLCEVACPEDAVSLVPRMAYDRALHTAPRVLNEESPFCCVSCGTPFATRGIIERMREKLAGHWMFQDPAARRRLEMCQDCRVADLFGPGGMPS